MKVKVWETRFILFNTLVQKTTTIRNLHLTVFKVETLSMKFKKNELDFLLIIAIALCNHNLRKNENVN